MLTHPRHPHAHPHLPLRYFSVEHPYAGDWALLTAGTLIGLLLWYWNR